MTADAHPPALPVALDEIQFGLDTFGDVTDGPDGSLLHSAQVVRNVVAEGVLADEVGVDFFGVGEHHRRDYAVSAPDMVLAAIAGRTRSIRLGTSVTVLSSDDPIRVQERFATLDAVSNGRAEVTLGRGSFIESFPLFGFDLADYERLFAEKLDLFTALRGEVPVSWSGSTRAPLENAELFPKTENGLPSWVAVGGSPESVVRAARYRMPLMVAHIGGPVHRFAPFTQLFHRAVSELGGSPLPTGVHSPGHVARTDEEARDQLRAAWSANRAKIGAERGWGPPREGDFEREVETGALYVGSPETVARKIAASVQALGVNRFDLKYSNGTLSHEHMMTSVELYGTQVVPRVRELLAESGYVPTAAA